MSNLVQLSQSYSSVPSSPTINDQLNKMNISYNNVADARMTDMRNRAIKELFDTEKGIN